MYRDASPCPRCGLLLIDGTCGKCRGSLLETGAVVQKLLAVAPSLMPASGKVKDLSTMSRGGVPCACPVCGQPMAPVFLGGIAVDRCYADEVIWFDDAELDTVLARAEAQTRPRTWREWLLGL